jgi:hypothetical protein
MAVTTTVVAPSSADINPAGTISTFVMAGLVPAIHVFDGRGCKDVDARDKRGHDGAEIFGC